MIIKRNIYTLLMFVILIPSGYNSLMAQSSSEKVNKSILETLKMWNTAAENANVAQAMLQFDNSENIMLIGFHGKF